MLHRRSLPGVLFLAASGCLVAGFLLGVHGLPMQDYPEHAHMAAVLSHGAPESGEPVFYETSLTPRPYVLPYWVLRGLSLLMPAEVATRLLVLAYALGCLAGTVLLLRAVRPELPLLAAAAVGWWVPFSFFYYMGLLPFLTGIPLLLLAMALFQRMHVDPGWRSALWAGGMLVLLYLTHIWAIALGVAALAFMILVVRPPEAVRARSRKAGLAVLGLGVVLFLAGAVQLRAQAGLALSLIGSESSFGAASWADTAALALRLPLGPLVGMPRLLQWIALLLLVAAVLSSLLPSGGGDGRGRAARHFRRWMFVLAAAVFVGSFTMAGTQASATLFHRGLVVPYFLALIGWAAGAPWRRFTVAAATLSAALHLGAVTWAHVGFDREYRPAEGMLAHVPGTEDLLPLLFDRDSETVRDEYVHVFHHVGATRALSAGSRYLMLNDHPPKPVTRLFSREDLPPLEMPWQFEWNGATREAGFVLVRAPSPKTMEVPVMETAFRRTLAALDRERTFLGQDGSWALWGPPGGIGAGAEREWPFETGAFDTENAGGGGQGHPPTAGPQTRPGATRPGDPHGGTLPAGPSGTAGPVPRAAGPAGRTVAEVHAQREALRGREVAVRGRVVKFTSGILGRNWLHLQDGSGSAEGGDFDLTVATQETASVGEIVTARGELATDRDLGFGYLYDVLLEDAGLER